MSIMISVRLSEDQLEALDEAVRTGRYRNRTQAVRELVEGFARAERRRRLAERFRRAYATPPTQDERELQDVMDEAARLTLFDAPA